MPLKYNNTQPTEIKYNGTSLTDVKYGSTVVWRKRTVTYYSETGTTRTATYIEGQAISLSANYAVAKSGYSFVGWRQDRSASSSVISSLTMGSSNVSLYAVYRKSITVTYYNNSTSATSTSGYQYYNTGNVTNPSFKLTQSSRSGWNARGWSTSTAANGSISYNNGASFTIDSNITLRGMYQKTVTLSYNGNGATGGSTASQSGTAYYNSGSNSTTNPSFTLRSNGFSRTNYRFVNWRLNSTSGTAYNVGATVTLSNNTVFYAAWQANYSQSIATINGYAAYLYSQGIIPFMTVPNYGSVYKLNTSSITGNTLKLKGNYASVIANISCNISISVNLSCCAIDTFAWYLYYVAVYKNGSHVVDLLYKGYDTSYTDSNRYQNCISTYNISANAGDTIEVRVQGGVNGSGNTRTQYSGTVTFTGTPNL